MYYIGIDLGGTNIAVGLVDEKGKIVEKMSVLTNAERDYKEIVADMAAVSKQVIEKFGITEKDVAGVGIGCPGSIDNENGVCVYANNLHMDHAEIAKEFRKHLDLPVNLENDANAAALGEYKINGNGASSFVFVTLGTGVGGGIVLDGKIFRGFNGIGGEIGHTALIAGGEQCSCGRKGCWEAYASVTGLIRQTKAVMEKNPESLMHKLAEEEGKVSGMTSFVAAKKGDKAGLEVVEKYFEYVGEGIADMINIFQPEKIVIGGSISKEGEYLLKPVSEYVDKIQYNKSLVKTKIEIATLFGDAGIIGAALSVLK